MASLILRDIPEEVHKRLRDRATRHRRSMTREAVDILERDLLAEEPVRLPPLVPGGTDIPAEEIDRAVDEGHE